MRVKKNLILAAAFGASSFLLFACGNPLKQLPMTSEENRYADSSTGNEALDAALKDMSKDGAVKGVVSSVVVYDRLDDKENKDQADVSVKIESESAYADYMEYYTIDFRYTKDLGWRVKDYELDANKTSSVTPLDNLTQEQVEKDLADAAPKASADNGKVELNFAADLKSAEIFSEEINTTTEDLVPVDTLTADFTVDGGYCDYTGSVEMIYRFQDEKGSEGWVLDQCTVKDNVERQLNADTLKTFADKRMLNIICTEDIQIGNRIFQISEENVASYEFSDCVFDGNVCTRTANVVLATGSQIHISLDASFRYTFAGGTWKVDEFKRVINFDRPQLIGEYAGDIYNSKEAMEAGEESIGRAFYSILEQDEEGNISGAIRYLNDGQEVDEVEPIYFKANYYENNMTWTVIFVSDVDDKNYGFNYEDLVFDPFSGDLVIDRRTHYYRLVMKN